MNNILFYFANNALNIKMLSNAVNAVKSIEKRANVTNFRLLPFEFCATQFRFSLSLSFPLSLLLSLLLYTLCLARWAAGSGFQILKNVFRIFQYLHFELNQFQRVACAMCGTLHVE